jgi:hypothetical protein
MPSYKVTWTIDIEADDPLDAASQALFIHRNTASIATVFDVTNEKGETVTIDFEEGESC